MSSTYRVGLYTLALTWGVLDTATTLLVVGVGTESNPLARWLLEIGWFVEVKLVLAGLVIVFGLAAEPHLRASDRLFRAANAAIWLLVVLVLALGPLTHAYVWVAAGSVVVFP